MTSNCSTIASRFHFSGLLVSSLLLLLLSINAFAAPAGSPQAQAFGWFDGLGFPDLKDRPLVRVATGNWSRSGNEPASNHFELAFLLKDDGASFSVFSTDLSTTSYTKTPATQPAYSQVSYEPADLKSKAADLLDYLNHPKEEDDLWRRFGALTSKGVEVFVFARACDANGLEQLGSELYTAAANLPDRKTRQKPVDFRAALSNDIAYAMIWKATLKFEDPSIPRTELLATLEQFVKNFPDSEYAPQAKGNVEILRKMVREDETHSAAPLIPPEKMSTQQRIAELIFQLRDQNGHQYSDPGSCDIFFDARKEKSPASQLVSIGYDAIPQLIKSIGDDRLTRCVGWHRSFYFSHYVLRVGDCAQTIISRIAGKSFYEPTTTSGAMFKDGQADRTRKAVQEWWDEFQQKGEKQMLLEATVRGDGNSTYQGERLVEKYADIALPAIIEGIRKADNDWIRSDLISLAGKTPGDAANPFLLEILNNDRSYRCRVVAARALHRRKQLQAVPAIIQLWNQSLTAPQPANEIEFEQRSAGLFIPFLASCDNVDAIHALGKDLDQRPANVQMEVLSYLNRWDTHRAVSGGTGSPATSPADDAASSKACDQAIEELLIGALQTTAAREGASGSWGDWSYVNPLVCDAAGYVLQHRWPDKYKFDGNASLTMRDRQRIELINIWRKEKQLAPLSVPEPVKILPADASVIGPLLKSAVDADSPEHRAQAIKEIEALGPPALQPLRARLAELDAGHPAKAELEQLASRLASIVREARVGVKSVPLTKLLQDALDSAKSKTLRAEQISNFVVLATRGMPDKATGIRIVVNRSEEMSGIVLEVTLLSEQPRYDLSASSQSIFVGGKSEGTSSSSVALIDCMDPDNFKDFNKTAATALKSPADQPVEIRLTVWDKQ